MSSRWGREPRGAVGSWTAGALAALIGFGAIALDTGRLYAAKSTLQSVADAAVWGAATELGSWSASRNSAAVAEAARRCAERAAEAEPALGAFIVRTTPGRSVFNNHLGKYEFTGNVGPYNAVRVSVRPGGGGSVPGLLAPVLGSSDSNRRGLAVRATAMVLPRDIALVVDLSASHDDDGELKPYRDTRINLEEVRRSLPTAAGESAAGGGEDRWVRQGHPRHEPLWGYTKDPGGGDTDLGREDETRSRQGDYDPVKDLGLVYLPRNRRPKPARPSQAVKDAVRVMADLLAELQDADKLSLESYDRWGDHRKDLTYDYESVADDLEGLHAGQDRLYANMGDGIQQGVAELTGPRARAHAVKIMVLLTNGRANVNEAGGYSDYAGGREWALASAEEAAAEGIRLYCISVGPEADRDLMRRIAGLGKGAEFHTSGSIADYPAQLATVLETLSKARPVTLIE